MIRIGIRTEAPGIRTKGTPIPKIFNESIICVFNIWSSSAVIFPSLPGNYTYRVTPVFMDDKGQLSYGDYQEAAVQLEAETYPGKLNVAFTRGFIASQAFVDNFGTNGGVGTIIPQSASAGLEFKATYPNEEKALSWMGFEARQVILSVLDQAINDTTAQVRVAAYDFNDPEIVSRLVKLGNRLKIIIDNSGSHAPATAPESKVFYIQGS